MGIRKLIFVVVALILLLGGSYALSLKFASMKKTPPRRPAMEMKRYVKAQDVVYGNLISALEREGRVVSGGEVTLVSEASGKIEKGSVALRRGEAFIKGQLIAVIYKDEVELALKARKSRFLTTITGMLPDLRVDFPNELAQFEAFFAAIEIENKLPQLPEVKDTKLKIFLASRNVLSEYYDILQDEKKLERHSLYAPFDGAFIQVNFELGGYVNTGGQIAKMIRTDMMEIEVPVENGQSKWIKVGDKVKVLTKDSDVEIAGVVVRKANYIDETMQARSMFVKIENGAKTELLAGEYKRVLFPGQLIHDAMEIPRSAIFNFDEVFVVEGGKLIKKKINILKYNDETIIFSGLDEGQKVVVEPLVNVKENSPVGIFGEEPKEQNQRKGKGKPMDETKKSS